MLKRREFLPCLVAVGIALTPLPAFASGFEGFSRENLSIGLEFDSLNKGLDATTALYGIARVPNADTFAGEVENAVDKVKLTAVLARLNYRVNDHFTPYLLLGTSGLAFDDSYKINIASLLSADTTVPYSDSQSFGYGFGAGGVLMALPAQMKLSYGVRVFTFTSSDDAAVAPEEFSSLLARLNPVEKVIFSTDVTFTEWDLRLGVSREYQLDRNYTVTPELGYRHSSISMKAATEIEYSPGMPYYMQGSFDRELGGSLSSVTLGVTGRFQERIGATLQVAVGDETGISLAVNYGF